jgi:hypothetical protein
VISEARRLRSLPHAGPGREHAHVAALPKSLDPRVARRKPSLRAGMIQ